jgi:protein-S-isoprenylcysteine O-methyltransferase Ste14
MDQQKQKLNRFGIGAIIREYVSRILVLILLLVASGDSHWPRAWLLFWLMVGMNIIFHMAVVIPAPDLYNERGRIALNAEVWDRRLLAVYALSGYLAMITMGLDKRFGWTSLHEARMIPGAILIGLSFALSAWAMRVNHYFSSVVRIQGDRGQVVCNKGPYRIIRHPGYFSAFLFYGGTPLVLGAATGFIFLIIVIGLFAYRITREEEILIRDLPGYEEYRSQVRFRLVPGFW